MKMTGIVAEYNPFHNGHAAMIQQLRENGTTHVVCVMSPNFVQRGEPALLDKWARTQMALRCGADLIFELPTPWAMAAAETFAVGAVHLLDALGCINTLAFGSECGDIPALNRVAQALCSDAFAPALHKRLDGKLTFAVARQRAVTALLGEHDARLLQQPNNILGIEYNKALIKIKSNIKPETIKRIGTEHDGTPNGAFCGASYIREHLNDKQLKYWVPSSVFALIKENQPADIALGERAVLARLRSMQADELINLPDMGEGLHNRLIKQIKTAKSLQELFDTVKTKRYTHARIRRLVWSAFLGITAADTALPPPYLRLLGMNQGGRELLATIKKTARLPLIAARAQISRLNGRAQAIFETERRCSDLYGLFFDPIKPCGSEDTAQIIKMEE